MKTRPRKELYKASRSEKKRYEKEQIKEIKAELRRPLITEGSFDWTERARQAEELWQARDLLARLRSKYVEANELLPVVGERYVAAMRAAYPPGFWENYERLRAGDPVDLDPYIGFLEADPWFFRTGYEKADIIRAINRLDLSEREKERLREVVLHVVDLRDRREFRAYCRLARKVDDPTLRAALTERLQSEDEGLRRRARWVLEALDAIPKGDQDRQYLLQKFLKSPYQPFRDLARMQLGMPSEGQDEESDTNTVGDNDES